MARLLAACNIRRAGCILDADADEGGRIDAVVLVQQELYGDDAGDQRRRGQRHVRERVCERREHVRVGEQ